VDGERVGGGGQYCGVGGCVTMNQQLRFGYLYDPDLRAAANGAGRNYWDVYIGEILDQLGLRAEAIARPTLEDAAFLTLCITDEVGEIAAQRQGGNEISPAIVEGNRVAQLNDCVMESFLSTGRTRLPKAQIRAIRKTTGKRKARLDA